MLHVVTGGAGFLGSHLCDAIVERGHRVICVDNLVGTGGSRRNIEHLLDNPLFTWVNRSVLDWASAEELHGVDTVFHQAASKMTVSLRDPELDLAVNALGTQRLLLAAARSGVRRFVHGSTGSVYGELLHEQSEEHPTRPVSLYGVSKLAGESYCRAVSEIYDLDFTVLRYFHIIGPRQDDSETGGVVPIFLRRCMSGQNITIFGSGEQQRSFTSVFDVVAANLICSHSAAARGRFLNCASGIQVSINELALFCREITGAEVQINYEPPRPGDIVRFNVNNLAIREIGVSFERDWRKVVRQVYASKLM